MKEITAEIDSVCQRRLIRWGLHYFLAMGNVKVAPSHPITDTSGTKDRMSIKYMILAIPWVSSMPGTNISKRRAPVAAKRRMADSIIFNVTALIGRAR